MDTIFKPGQRIRIKPNLREVMERLQFDATTVDFFERKFVNTFQCAHGVWSDDAGMRYVTVDLCFEIPAECCSLLPLPPQ